MKWNEIQVNFRHFNYVYPKYTFRTTLQFAIVADVTFDI